MTAGESVPWTRLSRESNPNRCERLRYDCAQMRPCGPSSPGTRWPLRGHGAGHAHGKAALQNDFAGTAVREAVDPGRSSVQVSFGEHSSPSASPMSRASSAIGSRVGKPRSQRRGGGYDQEHAEEKPHERTPERDPASRCRGRCRCARSRSCRRNLHHRPSRSTGEIALCAAMARSAASVRPYDCMTRGERHPPKLMTISSAAPAAFRLCAMVCRKACG